MPARLSARYRCLHCARGLKVVRNTGPRRRLWCGVCACTRVFARSTWTLRAATWPPAPRRTPNGLHKDDEEKAE